MRAALFTLAVLLAGCGGLDNRPLYTGAVTGRALDCDAAGVVGVVGDGATRVSLDSSCGFRVEGLEPGPHQLFVAPTGKKVALVGALVNATEVTDVGEVLGRPGAFARLQVSAPGRPPELAGQVVAPELPLSVTQVGRSGFARIGPFPAGCYRLEVTMTGLGHRVLTSCLVEGEEKAIDLEY